MSDIQIRFTEEGDGPYLTEWLSEPDILRWFPMVNAREVEDAVRVWIGYSKLRSALTAEKGGIPCGLATLYIQPYKKLAHQCLFSIIVKGEARGQGVGSLLLKSLIKLAKEQFHIEILHLEVYEGNPAINLYRRMGFKEYGVEARFTKEKGKYLDKVLMQREL